MIGTGRLTNHQPPYKAKGAHISRKTSPQGRHRGRPPAGPAMNLLADGPKEKVPAGFRCADIFKSESLFLLVISHHRALKGWVFHV